MILRKLYNWIDRTTVVTNRWNSLIDEEIVKESIGNYHIPVLKAVKKYVEDNGGRILFVDRPKFPSSRLSKSEKQTYFILWNNRIIKLLYNLRLLGKDAKEKLTRNYTQSNLIGGTPNKLRKNYMVNEDFENGFIRVIALSRQRKFLFAATFSSLHHDGSVLFHRMVHCQ